MGILPGSMGSMVAYRAHDEYLGPLLQALDFLLAARALPRPTCFCALRCFKSALVADFASIDGASLRFQHQELSLPEACYDGRSLCAAGVTSIGWCAGCLTSIGL